MGRVIITSLDRFNESSESYEFFSGVVEDFMNDIESRYDVETFIHYSKYEKAIILSKIVIPKKSRGKGFGSKIMQELCDLADKHLLQIGLTPSSDLGGSKTRLIEFYKRFGFKKYKGFEINQSMVRDPQY